MPEYCIETANLEKLCQECSLNLKYTERVILAVVDIEESVGNNITALQKIIDILKAFRDKVHEDEKKLTCCETENIQLRNRMNTAYIIAGSALGVSVVQLILLFTGVF